MTRYEINHSEGEFEPGSNKQVLKNKLGVTDPNEIDKAEYLLLKEMEQWAIENTTENDQLTAKGIQLLHKTWLSPLLQLGRKLQIR